MWTDFSQIFLLIFTSLLPVVNPPGAALMILGVLPQTTKLDWSRLASAIALNSLIMLAVSLFVGAYVLAFFGISVPVLRLAGGFVIAATGWSLLRSPATEVTTSDTHVYPRQSDVGAEGRPSLGSQIFYPLTMPFTVGPGSIAVAIAVGTGSPKGGPELVHIAAASCALLAICLSIYLSVRYANRLKNLLGPIGSQVALRLLAFFILCIGVQIGWLGLSELLSQFLH